MVIIGIDPHKSSFTAVAVDRSGVTVGSRRFVVNAGTATALVKWCQRWPERQYAIEGAKGLGRGIAQILVARGEDVVDVPSTLAMKVRVLSTGGGRKTDPDDARAVALTALYHHGLHQVHREDQSTILRLLSERRDDLTREKTRVLNRLHQLLRELIPGGVPIGLSADKAGAAMRRIKPTTATDACRRDLAKDVLADLRRIDSNIKANEAQMRDAVAATTTTLQEVHGINTVLAAKLLGHIGNITRFPSADHFAGYTGTAPLAASSGENTRHRLNTGGNRQLNSVLHTIAVCQARDPGPGRVYYQRKLDEGKTRAEARRALKRRLANVLYRRMRRDQQHAPPTAA
ncbi:IS110 family transposase [Rhodococcus sp. ZPP]|uniref:IS110 family transposase n=1 Tax=Rhodococcus sp. ZPP TaxID=2749906 RepID=UPI001AD89D4E|nr:IS110 family transposase [Rhodococcus sp. ZPP]QTJ64497.1 IS110 family transposase [Rhodococcus sp. ZPP]QTJ67206.1 IS110 family transposase [Rhodococcus sp. ZPP]